jgi:AraC-like DNA-binding protein
LLISYIKPCKMVENGKLISPIVVDAVNYLKQSIEKDPLQRICIKEVTAQTCIGLNRFYKGFKQLEGETIVQFKRKKRIEMACRLLETGRCSVKTVAFKCGYSRRTNFTSDFKKVYKMSPRKWLQKTCPSG